MARREERIHPSIWEDDWNKMSGAATLKGNPSVYSENNREMKWTKPDLRFIKVNVDAAYFADESARASAAVIRDDKGNFLAAQCKYIPHVADAMMVEATAMRDGLVFANSLGFPRVEAESDSLNVINFCDGQSRWWDAATTIFAEMCGCFFFNREGCLQALFSFFQSSGACAS